MPHNVSVLGDLFSPSVQNMHDWEIHNAVLTNLINLVKFYCNAGNGHAGNGK